MKIGHQLFAILAFGALSTNAAFAGHHSHHHHHYARGAAAHGYGHDVDTSAKTGISTDTAPHHAPAADPVESAKTGISTDIAPHNAPAADYGHYQAATAGAGPSGKEGAADTAIDTSNSVHLGRETINNGKQRSVTKTKTTKTTGAPGSGRKYQIVHNHQHESPVGSDGGLHRNAIGAVVDPNKMEHNKTVEHGSAAGPVTHDLVDTKPVIDNAPVNKLSPGAAQNKDHSSVTTALALIRTNGLGIVGTGSNRPGIGMAALGGPAQIKININTGVLSGNMFHPRHP